MRNLIKNLCAFLVLALLLPIETMGDAPRASRLMGVGLPPQTAGQIDTELTSLAAVGTDASGNSEVASSSGKAVELILGGDQATRLSFTSPNSTSTAVTFGDGTPTRAHLDIHGATTDGDDDGYIIIGPGGANSLERGSAIVMYGNETTGGNEGDLKLDCGNVADSVVEIITPESTANTNYRVRWYWQHASGNFYNDATYGGNVVFQKSGTTIAVDSGTAASACKGTGTYNGTTAVTVSTTCATTGAIVMTTPTSDPTGSTAAYCWVTNIVNATSFDVDCDQANDGTFSWLIVKEG